MVIVMDKRNALISIYKNIDEAKKVVKDMRLEVDTTTARDWQPQGYIYDPYSNDDWKEFIDEIFDVQIIELELGEEVNF